LIPPLLPFLKYIFFDLIVIKRSLPSDNH
jgi:hypothetical protein